MPYFLFGNQDGSTNNGGMIDVGVRKHTTETIPPIRNTNHSEEDEKNQRV
jgi:hypothetical protein